MTPAERRKRWDQRMRNTNGEVPGQPKRTPVTIYLSDQARAELTRRREMSKHAQVPGLLDSELIEELLLVHGGYLEKPFRDIETQEQLAEKLKEFYMRDEYHERQFEQFGKAKPGGIQFRKQTIKAVLRDFRSAEEKGIEAKQARDMCLRHVLDNQKAASKLIQDIIPFADPLLTKRFSQREVLGKFTRRIADYIETLFEQS